VAVIGLATLLYTRLTDSLSLKMQAFDSWTEAAAAEELGIPETAQNAGRAAINQRIRDALRQVPRERYMRSALEHYEFFSRTAIGSPRRSMRRSHRENRSRNSWIHNTRNSDQPR
jgi:hypothetical protein